MIMDKSYNDMMACQLEGWDQMEYIRDLQDLLNSFKVK